MTKESGSIPTDYEKVRERVVLVGVVRSDQKEWQVKESLQELEELVSTAGGDVVKSFVMRQAVIHPGCYIGTGKAEEVSRAVIELDADTVVFDDDLSPAQGRNLGRIMDRKVIDRTQVILDIFGLHAKTREGRLQVELARLEYTLPRLRNMWSHLERQTGGIGVRGGPGEQQMELDRRRLLERIHRSKEELIKVAKHREELRRGQRRSGWAMVSLVGYTNAGKSSILNRMTDAEVVAQDALFVTLDTVTRKLELPNHQPVLLSDTVGFIRKLPHHLVEAFKATLEEVADADLLLHVVDCSHENVDEQIDAVNEVLDALGCAGKNTVMVLNKIDREQGAETAKRLHRIYDQSVPVSAHSGEGMDALQSAIADALRLRFTTCILRIPQRDARYVAQIRSAGHIMREAYDEAHILLMARIPQALSGQLSAYLADASVFDAAVHTEPHPHG
ncbi:MAG: GTPase HflX [Spartobacteria bacterium]|nr:GTPase HflX [Spartobacteria bacterium]